MGARLIQTRFDGGELSSGAWGRLESDLYKRALSRCANFIPTALGSAITRGMMERMLANPAGKDSRLIDFRSADGQSYTLVLGNLTMRVVTATGIITAGVGGLILDGTFDVDTGSWALDSASISGGKLTLFVTSEYVPPLTYSWGVATQYFNSLAGNYTFRMRVLSASSTRGVRVTINVGAYNWTQVYHAPATVSEPMTLPAAAGSVMISYESASHSGNVSVDDVSLIPDVGADLVLVSPWTLAQLDQLQWVSEQSSVDRLIFTHPNVAPWELKRTAAGVFTLTVVVFTAPPANWAGANWPSACEIFQGRLYLGGTPSKRNSLWASKPGALYDFTVGVGGDGDAISEKVATKGAIRWIQGHRILLLGTEVGDYVVTGSQGLVTANDFQATQHGGYGSAPLHAIFAAGQALYVSKDFRRVRSESFNFQADAWESADLTLAADHMTKVGIEELYFAAEPYELVLARLSDGTIAGGLLRRDERGVLVSAWWRLTTDGDIRSASLSQGPEGAVLWLSVKRRKEVSIEKLVLSPDHDYVLDAAVRLPAPADVALAGLGHLEGETVRVIADGALQANKVVAAGAIVLDAPAVTEVVVGLALPELRLTTLPKDVRDERTRDAKLGVILHDSALPLVGGHRPADRTPSTPTDSPEPRRTGKFRVAGKLGWSDDGTVEIMQDLPFRTEVLAIYESAD